MADKYFGDRKLHDLLPKHSTVDICDGSSGAVEEFSHHPGINQTRQAEMEADSGGNNGSLNSSNGWMQTLLCKDSTVGRGCNAWIMKQALAYQGSRVKVLQSFV